MATLLRKKFRDPAPPGVYQLQAERALDGQHEARVKELAWAQVLHARDEFVHEGIHIRILYTPLLSHGGIILVLQGWQGERPMLMDNPYIFANPPILRPDGTWRLEGGKMEPNFVEDVYGVAKATIVRAVRLIDHKLMAKY